MSQLSDQYLFCHNTESNVCQMNNFETMLASSDTHKLLILNANNYYLHVYCFDSRRVIFILIKHNVFYFQWWTFYPSAQFVDEIQLYFYHSSICNQRTAVAGEYFVKSTIQGTCFKLVYMEKIHFIKGWIS